MTKKIKIIILLALIGLSGSVFAQDVKTKTVTPVEGVTKTYSYYLDKNGKEVLHGKFSITNKYTEESYARLGIELGYHLRKDDLTLTCNYKDGIIHGLLTFKNNSTQWFAKADGSKNWVEKPQDRYKYNTSFTVNVYEGILDGDINITYGDYIYKGKAKQGILVDDTEFVVSKFLKAGTLINGKNYEQIAAYKNLKPVSTNSNLQHVKVESAKGFELSFGYYTGGAITEMVFLELPFFVDKDFDKLSDISEYKNILKNEKISHYDANKIFDKIKKEYNLSESDKELMNKKLQEINDDEKARKEKAKEEEKTFRKKLLEEAGKINNYPEIKISKLNKGGCIENVICDLYTKYTQSIPSFPHYYHSNSTSSTDLILLKYDLQSESKYDQYKNDIEKYTSDIQNYIANYDVLKKAQNLYNKILKIESLYTTRKPGNTAIGCSKDILNKTLYNSYIEVANFYAEKSKNTSDSEFINIINEYERICDIMINLSTNKDKSSQTEKLLKKAQTVEDKLKIFLQ